MKRLIQFFFPSKRKKWKTFGETSSYYLTMTESLIIGCHVTEGERILPDDSTPEERYCFLCFLLAYFSLITDINLEERKVPKEFREDLWNALIKFVFEEMGIDDNTMESSYHLILNIMETFSPLLAIQETKIVNTEENFEMIIKTALSTTISLAKNISDETRLIPENKEDFNFIKTRFENALEEFNSYASDCFDEIANVF